MSRSTPLPEVIITPNIFPDGESGSNVCNIVIDVKAGDFSNGVLALDEPGDLHILRAAIDDFINRFNVNNPSATMNTNESATRNSDSRAAAYKEIIKEYIAGRFGPAITFVPGHTRLMSSQDIIIELAEIADFELNHVACAMVSMGFSVGSYDGRVGWMLDPLDERKAGR